MTPAEEAQRIFELAGIESNAGKLVSHSPIDGRPIGRVTRGDPDAACARAVEAFYRWRDVPAPRFRRALARFRR
jgi:acyl-CoA reductase-like NAD-dependent aldehyde dehydrogenase